MSETSASTANMPSGIANLNLDKKSASDGAAPVSAPSTPTNVDMVQVETAAVTPGVEASEEKKSEGFDSDKITIPSSYIQSYLSGLNKQNAFKTFEDGFIAYNYTNSINDPEKLKDSFKREFLGQAENRKSFNESKNLFATLDNENYTYGRLFFQGSWVNTRTPIDPETGAATGLPEMLLT